MCNLGDYQKMTVLAKKVNGPRNLALLLLGAGFLLGSLVTGITIVSISKTKNKNKKQIACA